MDDDISLVSIRPIAIVGRSWEVFARNANGQDTIPLISIPEWDFNGKVFSRFPSVYIPAGM